MKQYVKYNLKVQCIPILILKYFQMDFRSTRRMVNRIDKNLGQGMPKVKKTIEKKNKVRHMADICLKVRYENQKSVNVFFYF